jgi:hypothetical protein
MTQKRVGILPAADRQAIFNAARQLQLNPYELGGFLSLESGHNMDPNIRGGAGGNYYGMIQFGPSERAKYLDPAKIGKYTRAEQMPRAVQFLLDRGFKPGEMGIERAYATVLGGNPYVPLDRKDSFGTSVASALPRFKSGGDLYKNAQRVLGDLPGDWETESTKKSVGSQNSFASPQKTENKSEDSELFQKLLMGQLLQQQQPSLMQTIMDQQLKSAIQPLAQMAPINDVGLAGLGFPSLLG